MGFSHCKKTWSVPGNSFQTLPRVISKDLVVLSEGYTDIPPYRTEQIDERNWVVSVSHPAERVSFLEETNEESSQVRAASTEIEHCTETIELHVALGDDGKEQYKLFVNAFGHRQWVLSSEEMEVWGDEATKDLSKEQWSELFNGPDAPTVIPYASKIGEQLLKYWEATSELRRGTET